MPPPIPAPSIPPATVGHRPVAAERLDVSLPHRQGEPDPARVSDTSLLTIRVSTGAGSGRTRLSAFDAALRSAGVADFNLIRLSSVIPPGAAVVPVDHSGQLRGGFGDRLYCVYAAAYASAPGEQAWAGMAWSSRDDGSGAGLFVEHVGTSAVLVERDLRHSLADLGVGRAGGYAEAGLLTSSASAEEHPVCAIVIATYATRSWDHSAG